MQDVKEQHFEVNKRQKIFIAYKIGGKEGQAGHIHGRPMVRGRSDVDRNCRAPKGFTARHNADTAR